MNLFQSHRFTDEATCGYKRNSNYIPHSHSTLWKPNLESEFPASTGSILVNVINEQQQQKYHKYKYNKAYYLIYFKK